MPQDQSLTQTLPEDPIYAFCPAYDLHSQTQQIRIVVLGMTGYIPTALVALSIDDAERLCDRFNRRLGLERPDWQAIVAQSMASECEGPSDSNVH